MEPPTLKQRIENNLVVFFLATVIGAFLAGIGAFKGILAIAQLEIVRKGSHGFGEPVEKSGQTLMTLNGWKYRNFEGGDLAAAELSLPDEQPRPEDIYATAPEARFILVWWKPSKSGFTYRYAPVAWDKHNPANFNLPNVKSNQVPIGLGGRYYDLFVAFEGTPPKPK